MFLVDELIILFIFNMDVALMCLSLLCQI